MTESLGSSHAGAEAPAVSRLPRVGQWRATYRSGEWVVLSGPTSLVALPVDSPERTALISTLWEEVLASSSIVEVASRLAAHQIDRLPSFAALFWTAEGMRSLVRGAVTVRDLDSGDAVANGAGIQTWSEAGLGAVRRVQIDLEPVEDSSAIELPLVVGAVRASTVTLDANDAAAVRSPQGMALPASGPSAVEASSGGARVESGIGADEKAGTGPPEPVETGAAGGPDTGAEPVADDDDTPDTEPMAALDDHRADLGQEVEWGQWGTDDEPTQALDTETPAPPPGPQGGPVAPAGVPGRDQAVPPVTVELAGVEDADTELMQLPNIPPWPASSTSAPDPQLTADTIAAPTVAGGPQILAAQCALGHPNSPSTPNCRVCGAAIAAQSPQLVSPPVVARLRGPDGSIVELDRTVLIGRAPSESASDAELPRLMTVASPGHDISRTHLQVSPDGWEIVVTDLHSTNGTMWVAPGSGRQLLKPGEPTPIPLGTELELGDGVTVAVEPAQ